MIRFDCGPSSRLSGEEERQGENGRKGRALHIPRYRLQQKLPTSRSETCFFTVSKKVKMCYVSSKVALENTFS